MKYKLYTDKIYPTPQEQILKARGIEDIDAWLNASMDDVSSWEKLGYDEIIEALNVVYLAAKHNLKTSIVVDCDVDGYTSAAIMINYFYKIYPDWVLNHWTVHHHDGKQHGLTDMRDKIPEKTSLIICPDSASNDYEEHQYWSDMGADILILDHHEAPHKSLAERVITLNNQLCDYPNKSFSGAGVAWQFCKAYDEKVGFNHADSLLDLCALGNCGDMMDYRNLETRAIIKKGFSDITNPFFYQIVKDNEYIINKHGGVNYRAIAFAVVPFINATVRSGTIEEKELIFKAMCTPWAYEKVPFTKRGHKGEEVSRYIEAAYKTASIKRLQTKLETESLNLLDRKVKDENLLDNGVLLLLCEPGDVEKNIAGLVANKLQAKYQRPSLVLTKSKTKDDEEYFYRGSMRNYSMSEIENFKDVLEETGLVEYAQGHQGAAGVGIAESNIPAITKKLNEIYKDVPKEPIYWVDYIWRLNDVSDPALLEIAEMKPCWGQEIPPSQVAIEDIDLSKCRLTLCGSKNDTLRMVLPNGVVLVKFGVDEDVFNQMLEEDTYMTCIVSPARNEWMGKVNGEGIVDDFIIEKKWMF